MAERRVFIRTLGCPKNEEDSERLRGSLASAGYAPAHAPEDADLVVVNTCSFIEAARRESVDAVLEELDARRDGQKVLVAGCLVERYGPELERELPEADGFIGLGSYPRAAEVAGDTLAGRRPACFEPGKVPLEQFPRAEPDGPSAYVKISEGCDRVCTFCAIPQIRGPHRSRTAAAVATELRWLVRRGVREVVLVAQDMSLYGRDLTGRWLLPDLLRRVGRTDGLLWLRMLYQYPRFVDSELLDAVADAPAAVPYFDLSLQHASGRLVRAMKRWGDGDRFLRLIERIREVHPDAILRSAFITGFPGETEADVEELAAFLREARIDWAGFFPYSREEGTGSYALARRVSRRAAEARADALARVQSEVAEAARARLVGRSVDVLVEGRDGTTVTGRTWREAPEVDAQVVVRGARGARTGDVVAAKVVGVDGLDLTARAVS